MPLVVPRLEAHPNERVRDGTIFVDGAPKGFGRGFVSFVDAKQGQARRRRAGARPRPAKTSRSNRFGSTFGRIGCSRRARSGERNSA